VSLVIGILGAAALFGASAWLTLGRGHGECDACTTARACAAGARRCESEPTVETDHGHA